MRAFESPRGRFPLVEVGMGTRVDTVGSMAEVNEFNRNLIDEFRANLNGANFRKT